MISDTVQLTHSQFKPHPPHTPLIRGGNDLKQSSPQTSSKYGRVLKIPQRDNLKGIVLTPCPPNTLPDNQGSKHISKHVHLPPISDKVQLTHHQTQLKTHPPQTTLTTGRTDATNSSPQMQPLADTVKQGFQHTLKHIRLPPISAKVQLTHNQTQIKPEPPQTNATKSSSRFDQIRHYVQQAQP